MTEGIGDKEVIVDIYRFGIASKDTLNKSDRKKLNNLIFNLAEKTIRIPEIGCNFMHTLGENMSGWQFYDTSIYTSIKKFIGEMDKIHKRITEILKNTVFSFDYLRIADYLMISEEDRLSRRGIINTNISFEFNQE